MPRSISKSLGNHMYIRLGFRVIRLLFVISGGGMCPRGEGVRQRPGDDRFRRRPCFVASDDDDDVDDAVSVDDLCEGGGSTPPPAAPPA